MKDERGIRVIAYIVLTVVALLAVLPFILLIVASLTDNTYAIAEGFSFFPKLWSLDAYLYIANKWEMIGKAYLMTVLVTVIGTTCCVLLTTAFSYGIATPGLPGKRVISFLVVFTMLFNGGLVATYYSYVNLFHVRNTIFGLLLPTLMMNGFFIILTKNYMQQSLPVSLLEAARIDGASEFGIFFKIVIPLSRPIITTVGLMAAIGYWNDWQNGLYYLSAREGRQYYTLQMVLNSINDSIAFLSSSSGAVITDVTALPSNTARMAIAVIGILPIIVAYPFFQKYLVKGITMGGVKE